MPESHYERLVGRFGDKYSRWWTASGFQLRVEYMRVQGVWVTRFEIRFSNVGVLTVEEHSTTAIMGGPFETESAQTQLVTHLIEAAAPFEDALKGAVENLGGWA